MNRHNQIIGIQKYVKNRTFSGASGITALNEEGLDYTMEDCVVIVTFEAQLHEVSHGLRSFLWPKLYVQRPIIRRQYHLPLRRRLQHVNRRHCCYQRLTQIRTISNVDFGTYFVRRLFFLGASPETINHYSLPAAVLRRQE